MAKIGGASKKGRQHTRNEGRYRKQAIRTGLNKERAWKRHLKKHPNDIQNQKAIEKASKG